jgi:hypothetical protein
MMARARWTIRQVLLRCLELTSGNRQRSETLVLFNSTSWIRHEGRCALGLLERGAHHECSRQLS